MPGMREALKSYRIERIDGNAPPTREKLVELPVALPDDEILIDRLGLVQTGLIREALTEMVSSAADSHGHLVLQLHPERYHIFGEALKGILAIARRKNAWMAPLRDVAKWQAERIGRERAWPNGNSFALTISGDIDAVTLGDFLGRRIGR